ncbi:MAG: hypothetical protein CBC53_001260 [Alphaproteobacteria bacterium TMED93]|jgi:exonuclease III|nr:MAG: hypothetical protein CBC53_001260 [Alphaproteobacteria bacterium TMED93]|tara:strand:- start:77 stop:787 length:711 start_codon:yes stop_codon:yes gene_type:complete
MRVLLWNCNNGLSRVNQVDYFKSFECDIAIVPELKESNIEILKPRDSIWITNNHVNPRPKGLGVLTFNDFSLEVQPRDEDMEIFMPLKVCKFGFSFNLLAVWNFYYACKQGRFKGVRGDNCLEWSALKHYGPKLSSPSLMVGDWNFGPKCFPDSFRKLCFEAKTYGLTSLYHSYFDLHEEETKHPTFITTRKNYHHIDHFFGSDYFLQNLNSYEVDGFENVVLSDHAPSLVEFKSD